MIEDYSSSTLHQFKHDLLITHLATMSLTVLVSQVSRS